MERDYLQELKEELTELQFDKVQLVILMAEKKEIQRAIMIISQR